MQQQHLSPAAIEQLKDLCARVRVAGPIDESIERELMGHLQDKALAYLSGQEKITEADALLLVEKHFGDPAIIQSMLRDVHASASASPGAHWARRLAAILVATSVIDFICFCLVVATAALQGERVGPTVAVNQA